MPVARNLYSFYVILQFIVILLLVVRRCDCFTVSLQVEVLPGGRECFHQEIAQGIHYEIEYQVISGGELDINFAMRTPSGNSIFFGDRKTEDAHKSQATDSGEYVFCFDNTFSHMSSKTIFFRLAVHDEATPTLDQGVLDGTEPPELALYSITLEGFKKSTDNVKENLEKSIQLQKQFSSIELRDRSIQEYNFERVNLFSGIQLFIMLSVGLVNVLMIRGLFDDKRRKVPSSNTSKLRT